MNLKSLFMSVLLLPAMLTAAVKVQVSGQNAVMDNGIIRAEFNAVGGRLVKLTAFKNGKNLTMAGGKDDKPGALKDFFSPRDFTLNTAEYLLKSRTLPDGSAELILSTPTLTRDWTFLSLEKTIRLAPASSRLDISVTINNKLERMAPYIFSYWSHNFFGVPDEDNLFIYADASGIRAAVPSSAKNGRNSRPVNDFTRNFIAMLGKKSHIGVVILPDFREMESLYSWYCKGVNSHDTAEFRLINDSVDNGKSITKKFSIAVVSLLENLSGAGKTGAGYLKQTPQGVELQLTGFESVSEKFQLFTDGKKSGTFTAKLAPGKLFKRALGSTGRHFRAVSKNFDLEIKLDADGKVLPLQLAPMAKKNESKDSEADTQWQFNPSYAFVTPHFVWQTGGKSANILCLVPTNGIRDVIELKQRFKFDFTTPTVFPSNWALSWRTVTDMHREQTGLEKISPYLKRRYNAIVIGANAGIHRGKNGTGSWSSYPENLRRQLLKLASSGTGLVIINPGKKDPLLKAVYSKSADLKKVLSLTADLNSAPYFADAEIHGISYGKGRIVTINFVRDAFIAPHPGYRGNLWKNPRPEHRFQEYQFALIGKLIHWSCGVRDTFSTITAKKDQLEIDAKAPGKGKIEIFDRFSNTFHTMEITFNAGKNRFKLPQLRQGRNYIHATAQDGSYGYAVCEHAPANFIKDISAVNNGTSFKGSVATAAPLKADETLQITVVDNLDRLLYSKTGKDGNFEFSPAEIVTNRHILCAKLLSKGRVIAESRREFYLPQMRNVTANYTNMLWLCGDNFPEYSYFYRYKQYSDFGFNFHYSGSGNNGMFNFVRFTDAECGSNGHGGSLIFYFPGLHDSLKKYTKTHNKKYLIRGRCPNNPEFAEYLASDHVSEKMAEFGTRRIFQLGDEMSMTFHNASYDVCMCQYCMKEFRGILKAKYGTLAKLNAAWDCKFKSWDEVLPLTFQESIFKDKRAGYVEHRLYMDEVFRRTLNGFRERLRKKYPGAVVGPTGVNGLPSPYSGNSNFYSMREFDCGSFYRDTRLTVSFNRDKRLVMRYRGYSNSEPDTVYSFWEGMALGERGNNNWFGSTFLLPDLRFSTVRAYYSKLLWELRSGAGDLLYHSSKLTDTVAILHSQRSLIVNFTKQRKTEFYPKERSFARMLEDLAIPHRFIAPEQLDELDKFKVLILPEASALSDDDAAKITVFVKRGGILIADVEPATFDEVGNKRQKPALDEVFGIDSSNVSLRKIKNSTFKDLKFVYAGRGIKAAGAKSGGNAKMTFGKAPLYLENRFGKGRTLLLNFVYDYTANRGSAAARKFLEKISNFMALKQVPGKALTKRPVMHGTFTDGANLYFVLLPETLLKEKFNTKIKSPFVLAQKAHLYDVRQGKYLGHGTNFNVNLASGNGTMLAALPYKVEKVAVTAPRTVKAGTVFTITAEIKAASAPANHVFNLTCTDPQGKTVNIWHRIAKSASGKHTFTIQSALNDLPGVWHFTVKDGASGVKTTVPVKFN